MAVEWEIVNGTQHWHPLHIVPECRLVSSSYEDNHNGIISKLIDCVAGVLMWKSLRRFFARKISILIFADFKNEQLQVTVFPLVLRRSEGALVAGTQRYLWLTCAVVESWPSAPSTFILVFSQVLMAGMLSATMHFESMIDAPSKSQDLGFNQPSQISVLSILSLYWSGQKLENWLEEENGLLQKDCL